MVDTPKRTFEEIRAALEKASHDGDIEAMVNLNRELVGIKRDQDNVRSEAEKGARDALVATVTDALKTVNLPKGVTVSGVVRRSDTGWDDLTVLVSLENVMDLVHAALDPVLSGETPSTARALTFGPDGVKVGGPARSGTARASTNGATRGRGWTLNGAAMSLGDVFESGATAEERAEYDAAKGDGNKQYAVRKAVAKRIGATQNA